MDVYGKLKVWGWNIERLFFFLFFGGGGVGETFWKISVVSFGPHSFHQYGLQPGTFLTHPSVWHKKSMWSFWPQKTSIFLLLCSVYNFHSHESKAKGFKLFSVFSNNNTHPPTIVRVEPQTFYAHNVLTNLKHIYGSSSGASTTSRRRQMKHGTCSVLWFLHPFPFHLTLGLMATVVTVYWLFLLAHNENVFCSEAATHSTLILIVLTNLFILMRELFGFKIIDIG